MNEYAIVLIVFVICFFTLLGWMCYLESKDKGGE